MVINAFASQAMLHTSWLFLQTFMHFELGGKRELKLLAMSHDHTSQQSKPVWATNLHPVGLHYYAGVVDNAEELLVTKLPHKVYLELEPPQRKPLVMYQVLLTKKTVIARKKLLLQ